MVTFQILCKHLLRYHHRATFSLTAPTDRRRQTPLEEGWGAHGVCLAKAHVREATAHFPLGVEGTDLEMFEGESSGGD